MCWARLAAEMEDTAVVEEDVYRVAEEDEALPEMTLSPVLDLAMAPPSSPVVRPTEVLRTLPPMDLSGDRVGCIARYSPIAGNRSCEDGHQKIYASKRNSSSMGKA